MIPYKFIPASHRFHYKFHLKVRPSPFESPCGRGRKVKISELFQLHTYYKDGLLIPFPFTIDYFVFTYGDCWMPRFQ